MKSILNVEKTRIGNFTENQPNSVHRSSLLVPVLPNSEVSISFLNHFLIKRKIQSVGCKITAIGKDGIRLDSHLTIINEPRVYTMYLQHDANRGAMSFLVEFYSSINIFIPFPAVMVNHRTKNSISSVHSFNRVLADVFEDDEVNDVHVQETAIDVADDSKFSTFFVLTAGPYNLQSPITLRLIGPDFDLSHTLNVDIPRFTPQVFKLEQIVPAWSKLNGTLFIDQPDQKLFYGRLFVGQVAKDGSFVGNHSYYDSSHVEGEYWDNNNPSFRTYPIINELDTLIRFYPIMSPSKLEITVTFNDANGLPLAKTASMSLISPGENNFELDIKMSAMAAGVDAEALNSFTVMASPSSGNTPTRINHQVVYRASALATSINTSLQNYNVFHSKTKPRTSWGQLVNSEEFETWLTITNDANTTQAESLDIKIYDERGYLATESIIVPFQSAKVIKVKDLMQRHNLGTENEFMWYEFESTNSFMTAISLFLHIESGNCAGEHNF